MEETKKSVKERIVIISNELRVSKDGRNDFIKAGYFKPDDIMQAINPLLEKYRLIVEFDMTFSKEIEMYRGELTIEDFDDDKGARACHLDIPMQELKGVGMAQSAGATQTYCKRYMFMSAFNISDNKADLDNSKNKPAEKINWEAKLKATKSLKEVQELWIRIPTNDKKGLQGLKDMLKQQFNPNESD